MSFFLLVLVPLFSSVMHDDDDDTYIFDSMQREIKDYTIYQTTRR